MNNILLNFKKIPLWSMILACVLLLGMSFDAHFSFSYLSQKPSFEDMMLSLTARSHYIFLLLIIYVGFKSKNSDPSDVSKNSFLHNLPYMMFLNLIYITLIIVSVFAVLLLKEGSVTFVSELTVMQLNRGGEISSTLAMFLSLILFYLQFLFLTALVFTINSRCKKIPFGYMGILLFTVIDQIASNLYARPLGIFPFEHATIEQSSWLTPDFTLDIAISVLYWCVLIAVAGIVCHLMNKPRKIMPDIKGGVS